MLILASQSPRRKELLGLFHLPFTVQVADIDEAMDAALPPETEVARVSRAKAEAIARSPEDIVIAADTIVVLAGQVLGKPVDEADAIRMLRYPFPPPLPEGDRRLCSHRRAYGQSRQLRHPGRRGALRGEDARRLL